MLLITKDTPCKMLQSQNLHENITSFTKKIQNVLKTDGPTDGQTKWHIKVTIRDIKTK